MLPVQLFHSQFVIGLSELTGGSSGPKSSLLHFDLLEHFQNLTVTTYFASWLSATI